MIGMYLGVFVFIIGFIITFILCRNIECPMSNDFLDFPLIIKLGIIFIFVGILFFWFFAFSELFLCPSLYDLLSCISI